MNVASHLRAGTVFDLIIVLLRIYVLYQFNLIAVLLAILYAVTVEFRHGSIATVRSADLD